MSNFTSEAERNFVVTCSCVAKVAVRRSNTAIPATTPGGTTSAAGDGDGDGATGVGLALGEAEAPADGVSQRALADRAGPPHPVRISSATAAAANVRDHFTR
jgi:hypothetical protein